MKGKWEVTYNPMMGEKPFAVVRMIDVDKTEHSGNREYHECGYMKNRDEAEAIAEQLNLKEHITINQIEERRNHE